MQNHMSTLNRSPLRSRPSMKPHVICTTSRHYNLPLQDKSTKVDYSLYQDKPSIMWSIDTISLKIYNSIFNGQKIAVTNTLPKKGKNKKGKSLHINNCRKQGIPEKIAIHGLKSRDSLKKYLENLT